MVQGKEIPSERSVKQLIIRLTGLGGQGIIKASYLLGEAAIIDGKNALQTQAYGSEARGGESRGEVIIEDGTIYELEPIMSDILIAMSQSAYEKFIPLLKEGGTLIIDSDLVTRDEAKEPEGVTVHSIPATNIAYKEIGEKMAANMVIIGFVNAHLKIVSKDSLEKAIRKNVPKGSEDFNLSAFDMGMKCSLEAV